MNKESKCPRSIVLEKFILHHLEPLNQQEIEGHIIKCTGCRDLIIGIYDNEKMFDYIKGELERN